MAEALTGIGRFLRHVASKLAYQEASDSELMRRFYLQRDESAFVALLKRHGPMILNLCRRMHCSEHDAEDILQAAFLLLARNAGSIRKRESVASWLYGVAQRMGKEMKRGGVRRQMREKQAADLHEQARAGSSAWDELQEQLNGALAKVPEKFRTPLLLCYLEGKTQEEAARHLGCPLGTVRSRLARGRERLKAVLERQGVSLSTSALTTVLVSNGASAGMPAALVQSTAKAATAYAAGQAAVALVSAQAAALVAKGVKVMALSKVKVAVVVGLLVGTLGVGGQAVRGYVAEHSTGGGQLLAGKTSWSVAVGVNEPRAAFSVQPPAKKERPRITLKGKVLGVNGNPAPGARLVLLEDGKQEIEQGQTGTEGDFAAEVNPDSYYQLVASLRGSGLDFIAFRGDSEKTPLQLRLVKDNHIKGRVVTTEGKPVSGARVAVKAINIYEGNSLEPFFAQWKQRPFLIGIRAGTKNIWWDQGLFPTTTDQDGRFEILGAGTERVVRLHISGPGLAEDSVTVVNRAGFDAKPYNEVTRENAGEAMENIPVGLGWLLHGPDLAVVMENERLIQGVVTDIDTGKPRAGIDVAFSRTGRNTLLANALWTVTDGQGRYEIRGARRTKTYMVEVRNDPMAGYVACQVFVEDKPGFEPIIANIRTKKGVIVTGKVIDAATKLPLPGFALVEALADNQFVKSFPESTASAWGGRSQYTDEEGVFRFVTIPGPVLLMGGIDPRRMPEGETSRFKYKPAVADVKYPQYFTKDYAETMFHRPRNVLGALSGNFCKVLELKPGTELVQHDIVIEATAALLVKIQDNHGNPVAGAYATGIGYWDEWGPIELKTDSCSAYHLEGKPRLMVFWQPTKKLLGTLALKGNEQEPVIAKLGTPGGLKGRLLGEDGKPLVGIVINVSFPERTASEIHDHVHRAALVETDNEGRFRIDKVIPGQPFSLWFNQAKTRFAPLVKMETMSVQSGAIMDIGEVKMRPVVEKQ